MNSMTTKRVAGNRALVFGFALAVLLAAPLLSAQPAHAKTFTVDLTADFPDANPGDDACLVSIFGGCTLRAAIQQANATDGADTINFNIPGSDATCDATTKVCTISADPELPFIAETLIINGYSQPGAGSTLTSPYLRAATRTCS
jgi:CSLREA domain-containing protein